MNHEARRLGVEDRAAGSWYSSQSDACVTSPGINGHPCSTFREGAQPNTALGICTRATIGSLTDVDSIAASSPEASGCPPSCPRSGRSPTERSRPPSS